MHRNNGESFKIALGQNLPNFGLTFLAALKLPGEIESSSVNVASRFVPEDSSGA
jgi:hypothetical protein